MTGIFNKFMKKLLFTIPLLLLAFCAQGFADNISISATVDKQAVALDDQITLELTISGKVSDLPNPFVPDLSNFTVYSSGRSQSLSIVNGQMSSSVIYRYILVPKNVGKYTIRPITMQFDNKTYQTQPIAVEVMPAGRAPKSGQNQPAGLPATTTENQKDLFITAAVDKNTAYVNEQVVYTFRFFRRIRLLSNPAFHPADFTGFWTEDTAPKNYFTTINGLQYAVTEVKTLLFATKPGKFNLGSATLQCSVEDFNRNDPSADQFFASFFSGGRTQMLNTNPVTVTVIPLPEKGRPSNFSGAVGSYSIKASLDKTNVKANEPLTLSLTISGEGNIKTIVDPNLPDWHDFRKYETASTLNLSKEGDTLKGSKEFKTIIVPLTAGPKKIKPVTLSYFDPKSRSYRTASTGVLSVQVAPAAPGSAPTLSVLQSKNEINVLNSDIRYIKLSPAPARKGYLYKDRSFLLANALPLAGLLALFGYLGWTKKLSADPAFARRLRASGAARKYLKNAKKLAAAGKTGEYYCAISRAVLQYIADKANVSADGLTAASIGTILTQKRVSPETIARVTEITGECDLVRFAPVSVTSEMMPKIYAETEELIGKLEKEMQ